MSFRMTIINSLYINDNPLTAYPWTTIKDAKHYQSMFDDTWILKELVGLTTKDI